MSFFVFDVALLIGLPATGRSVEFDVEEVSSKIGRMLRKSMAGLVATKRRKWKEY